MDVKYFAVYDKKSNSYGQMFPSLSMGTAERSFHDSIKNPDSQHGKYPDDFALYYVLDFDDELGTVIKTNEPPQLVIEASALISQ